MPNKAVTFELLINGKPISPGAAANVKSIVVEQSFFETGRAEISFSDGCSFDLGVNDIKLDTPVSVKLGYFGEMSQVFEGEIVEVNPSLESDTVSSLMIIAYDYSHWLKRPHMGRQFTDTNFYAIANKVVSEAGSSIGRDVKLSLQCPAASDLRKISVSDSASVSQIKMTDWEILQDIANARNLKLICIARDVYLAPAEYFAQQQERQLTFVHKGTGAELSAANTYHLLSFGPRIEKADQRTQVEVESWDPFTSDGTRYKKEDLEGLGADVTGYTEIKVKSEITETIKVRGLARNALEAHNLAESELRRRADNLVQGDARVPGIPSLAVGQKHILRTRAFGDIGSLFSGEHTITAVRHKFSQEGFFTEFDVSRNRLQP